MTRRTAWIVGFLGGFLAWIAAELWAAFDRSSNTVPLTNIIVEHVPMVVGFPLIVAFALWLPLHFWIYWRKRHSRLPTVPTEVPMRDRFLAAWRTAVQAAFALSIAWLAGNGIHLNATLTGWLEALALAAGAGVWAWLTHWVQSLPGNNPVLQVIRWILGLGSTGVPRYVTPASPQAGPQH